MMTFFAPASMWPCALARSVKRPVFPRQSGGTCAYGQALDLMAIHYQHIILCQLRAALLGIDFLFGTALSGVIFYEVGEVVGRHEIVHCDHVDFLAQEALVADCTEHQATDAPETIDADLDHLTRSGVELGFPCPWQTLGPAVEGRDQ
jgi:hypothetical protein